MCLYIVYTYYILNNMHTILCHVYTIYIMHPKHTHRYRKHTLGDRWLSGWSPGPVFKFPEDLISNLTIDTSCVTLGKSLNLSMEKEMANHSSIFAKNTPRPERSTGSQRFRDDWIKTIRTLLHTHKYYVYTTQCLHRHIRYILSKMYPHMCIYIQCKHL